MATNQTKPKKQYESGHAKIAEAFGRLISMGAALDQTKLDAPPDLTIEVLQAALDAANVLQSKVGNSRADWRTIALDRATDIAKFAPYGAQAVGLLEGRGASDESVKDGRSYVRKLQGKRSSPKPLDDPSTPDIDESEAGVSASQQSSAAALSIMAELIDFLEAQTVYANVTKKGMTAADLRTFVTATQAKHTASIQAVATLAHDRMERDKAFYDNPDSLVELARRFKSLVKGSFGASSPEYKAINAIKFKRPKD